MKKRIPVLLCLIITLLLMSVSASYGADNTDEVRQLIKSFFVNDVSEEVLNKSSVQEMVYGLGDPYSAYIEPDDFKDFMSSLDGKYVGVGMYIQQVKDTCRVMSPMPGSPAEKAGIKPGDIITHVDGKSVQGLSSSEVAAKIRGVEGTTVSVTIKRGSQSQTFSLTRQTIQMPSVEYRMIGPTVGYINLNGFNSESPAEMDMALDYLISENAKMIVLDLRGNPGGLLDVAVAVAGEFVPEGPVVHVVQKGNKEYALRSYKAPRGLPVAVIVNEGSASAAEILAGAIQDAKTGIITGSQTFGKGSVQTVFTLSNGGGLKITTAKYLTRGRQDINSKGITPDIIENDENKQLQKALQSLEGDIKLYDVQLTVNSPIAFAQWKMNRLTESPYQQGGTVMVPLRSVAGFLGAGVEWKNGTAAVVSANGKIVIDVKKQKVLTVGSDKTLNIKTAMKNGQLMVPVRVLSEPLGYKVIWQPEAKSVAITR